MPGTVLGARYHWELPQTVCQMPRRRQICIAALPLTATPGARALDLPEGTPVLALHGKLRHSNRSGQAVLDMAMIERLPQASFSARTPWFTSPRKFTGPLLRDVLGLVGAQGQVLRAVALNDYQADLPVEDAVRYDVMLARLLDDKPMPVRDKGPLLIIYPFDQHSALRTALYYSRCVWQLKAIEVL